MSKILIIDDETDLVMLLEDELCAKGPQVLTAYNGKDGIELSKEQPDLIILDIMMPEADGFGVLRGNPGRCAVPHNLSERKTVGNG